MSDYEMTFETAQNPTGNAPAISVEQAAKNAQADRKPSSGSFSGRTEGRSAPTADAVGDRFPSRR